MKKYFIGLAGLMLSLVVSADIKTRVLNYQVDGETFTGYLAYDDRIDGKRPGILVVHEWWGHNGHVRKRAEMLAELGYTAFALDMYGSGKLAEHPEDARKFMQAAASNMHVAEKRFEAAYNLLRNQPQVDEKQLAAIGYCFGGGTSLHMVRRGMDLDAVVSFHGALGTKTPAEKGRVKAELLILTGAADPMIPAAQVDAFREEMTAAEVDYTIHSYPDAKHSFTNPAADDYGKRFDMPLAYDAQADTDSWSKMRDFLAKVFAGK